MNELRFVQLRQGDWERWDRWLGERQHGVKDRHVRKGAFAGDRNAIPIAELPTRFRALCHDLALARGRHYSSAVVDGLMSRVLLAHQRLYGSKGRLGHAIFEFFKSGFPTAVRRERRVVLAAAALLLIPLILVIVILQSHPEGVYFLIAPEQVHRFEQMYGAAGMHGARDAIDNWNRYAAYIGNNVKIDFQCFAGGIVFGLGSVFYLVYNGLVQGAVAGYLTQIGLARSLWSYVAGHSGFELIGAVLSGAAGLKLGLALIAPGNRSRAAALRENAGLAAPLLYGAAGMTFIAAFIEAFWSPLAGVPAGVKYAVGAVLWLVLLAYFALAGARHGTGGNPLPRRV